MAIAGLTGFAGCANRGPANPSGLPGQSGRRLEKLSDLNPEKSIGTEAKLVLGGTDIPVQVKEIRKNPSLVFELVSHEQVIEVERYQWTESHFSLVEATMETYDPPMPLIKFPMRVGDTWDWNGVLRNAAGQKPAKASITTGVAPVPGAGDTVRTVIKLWIDGGGAKPSEKSLSFYFSPNQGLIKREFGWASTREPVESAP